MKCEIRRNWGWMAQLLRLAVQRDNHTLADVRQQLESGKLGAMTAHDAGLAALIVVGTGVVEGTHVAWFKYVGGKSTLGIHAKAAAIRRVASEIETHARRAGCREMRFGGRAWSFLRGYEPHSTEMRKRLTDG